LGYVQMMMDYKQKLSLTATLSVKVTPEFQLQVRSEADARGLHISDLLREKVGFTSVPQAPLYAVGSPSATSDACQAKNKPTRPRLVAPPSGSDPVVVCLLASVANGLNQVAKGISRENSSSARVADAQQWLDIMRAMDERLATLIAREDGKNAS
jgi:hypothetical protein